MRKKYKKNPEREKWRKVEEEVCIDCPFKNRCLIIETCSMIKSFIKAHGKALVKHKEGWLWIDSTQVKDST